MKNKTLKVNPSIKMPIKNIFTNFRKHLNQVIIKPIKITNSNFFYLGKNLEVANISPIKELNYFIDYKTKEKNLKIKGKLFDVNFNFTWKKNYNDPNKIKSNISFTHPNISLSNISNKNYQNSLLILDFKNHHGINCIINNHRNCYWIISVVWC